MSHLNVKPQVFLLSLILIKLLGRFTLWRRRRMPLHHQVGLIPAYFQSDPLDWSGAVIDLRLSLNLYKDEDAEC